MVPTDHDRRLSRFWDRPTDSTYYPYDSSASRALNTDVGPATWATPKVPSRDRGDAVREGNNMSDLQPFMVHSFGPDWARDITIDAESRFHSRKPEPHNPDQDSALREVERLVTAALAMSPRELRACMLHDRYRFRMGVYQDPALAALREIFQVRFDRELYLWAYGQLNDDGVPSPVHGALVGILGGMYLDPESEAIVSGAWPEWKASRRPRQPEPRTMRR
jgi:hypothetical protein